MISAKNSISVKALATIVGIVLTLAGAGYGFAQVLATKASKIALAQTDAKANYGLHALLARVIAEVTLLKDKPEADKTADDWDQITFLRVEIQRLRKLISGGGT